MTLTQAVFLGAVQGLTEFLPLSSSGHLVLFQKILGLGEASVAFDVALHLGTLVAILVFFRERILGFLREFTSDLVRRKWRGEGIRLALVLVVGSVPAALGGLLISKLVERIFDSLVLVELSFMVTTSLLWLAGQEREAIGRAGAPSLWDSLVIGAAQMLALLPGVSRSGATIAGGVYRGLSRQAAFEFSFLLAIPVTFGAGFLELGKVGRIGQVGPIFIGMAAAGLVGYLALRVLSQIVLRGKFRYFALYTLPLGFLCLILAGFGF